MPQSTLRVPLGHPTLSQKFNEIKLAKPTKKEPRFPWDLGLLFVHPIKRTDCRILKLLNSK